MKVGEFSIQDAGFAAGINVRITKRNRYTGAIQEVREGHNRCLKQQLMGIVKWLNGEFNESSYLVGWDWVPRYLAIGTNTATAGTPPGISTEVTINDTRLLNEISPRMALPERNKIVNRSSQSYVQLIINTYLPEGVYTNETVGEAGLFSRETGNNCLFRIVFEPFTIDSDSVVEINWTISVISVESENKAYEEVDKADLRLSMEQLLDRFAELYPTLQEACTNMKDVGLYELFREDTTQSQVDKATQLMNESYANLANLVPGETISQEVIDTIDEINGEII